MAAVMRQQNEPAIIAIRIHRVPQPLQQKLRQRAFRFKSPRRSDEFAFLHDGHAPPIEFRRVVTRINRDDAPVLVLEAEKTGPLPAAPFAVAILQTHLGARSESMRCRARTFRDSR